MPYYAHQIEDINFIMARDRVLNLSDPGTGKTAVAIEVINRRRTEGRTLVTCPKTIMEAAWAADLHKFAPHLTYSLAYADNRYEAFTKPTDIVIMNHDGIKSIEAKLLKGFSQLIIDESTAFKTNTSQRSKIMRKLATSFSKRILMTGTPTTNSITDIWNQAFICDDGERLGTSFYRFRSQCCQARMLGNGITTWEDKPGIEALIYELLKDISIRHKLEDCIDLPTNNTITINAPLPPQHLAYYKELEENAVLEFQNSIITAPNAAVLATKLAQVASGSAYGTNGPILIDTHRYDLIAELANQRSQTVIAFLWAHQKPALLERIKNIAVIDGTTSATERLRHVQNFQNGTLRHLLIHPKAGAHGLTLTAGTTTIWSSPTYSVEEHAQFNRRIYRNGQTQKTETIYISAPGTIEPKIYDLLQGKTTRAINLLNLFSRQGTTA